jgi:hypothetical protein
MALTGFHTHTGTGHTDCGMSTHGDAGDRPSGKKRPFSTAPLSPLTPLYFFHISRYFLDILFFYGIVNSSLTTSEF